MWDRKKRSFRALAKVGMELKERRWVRGLRSGSRGVRTWGWRGWGELGVLERTRPWAIDKLQGVEELTS